MKKYLWLVSILALFLVSASSAKSSLKKLTVLNKSSMDIEMRLNGSDSDNFYYLRIPAGSEMMPTEKIFTVEPDEYLASLYYVELWDPVYGATCGLKAQSLDLRRNVRVVVRECDHQFAQPGEPPAVIKFGAPTRRPGRR